MGYDPNQARDDHGRWASEGGVAALGMRSVATDDVTGEPTVLKGGTMYLDRKSGKITSPDVVARDLAEKYGIDPNKVEVNTGEADQVRVGGKVLGEEAGHYDPTRDMVVLDVRTGGLDQGVAAHEFQHLKNEHVFTQFARELSGAREALDSGISQSAVDAKYPTYAALRGDLLDHTGRMEMAQEDGVSRYTSQYWNDWLKSYKTGGVVGLQNHVEFQKYQLALDETLADRNRLEADLSSKARGATQAVQAKIIAEHPRLEHLYQSINTQYTRLSRESKMAKSGLATLGLHHSP